MGCGEMYFTCKQCRYTFVDTKNTETCVDCGCASIRTATNEEIKEYLQYQQELACYKQYANSAFAEKR